MPQAAFFPRLMYEQQAKREGFDFIIGVDEAGRGPLAGPVVAAAVFLREEAFQNPIRDSKKINAPQREKAFQEIQEKACVGVGVVSEGVIDQCNILQATYQAMTAAVSELVEQIFSNETQPDIQRKVCLLIDGNSFKSDLPFSYRTIIGGDDLSLSIACASIVAKVTRDRILGEYDKIFPEYGFGKHKGYATLEHKLAIKQYGLSKIHRKTFHHA